MKKIIGSGLGILALALSVAPVFAVPPDSPASSFRGRFQEELNPSACEGRVGAPVLNITHGVTDDIDSGLGGYWAYDNYQRLIKLYATDEEGVYCALVRYNGAFDAVAGKTSPGGSYTLDGDEDGLMKGGYRGLVTGTLKGTPDYATHGYIGSFDYACNIDTLACSYWSWIGAYFEPGYGFDYEWWGWVYEAFDNGWWINSSDGNSGDIN